MRLFLIARLLLQPQVGTPLQFCFDAATIVRVLLFLAVMPACLGTFQGAAMRLLTVPPRRCDVLLPSGGDRRPCRHHPCDSRVALSGAVWTAAHLVNMIGLIGIY